MLIHPFGQRNSFSSYGKLLDLKNSQSSTPRRRYNDELNQQEGRKPRMTHGHTRKNNSTTAFTSVSRQKKGNFRFPIRLCKHQLKYKPNYFIGMENKPSWSMGKAQKTPRDRYVQYEICEKNPLFKRTQCTNKSSMDQIWCNGEKSYNKLASTRATSNGFNTARNSAGFTNRKLSLNKTCTDRLNYSIVESRQHSPVGKHYRSKISSPVKLDPQSLMNSEIQEKQAHENNKKVKCYVDMQMQVFRKPNINHEQSLTEDRFNNYTVSMGSQQHVHDFNSYSKRQSPEPIRTPIYDLLAINLDKIKQDTKRGNVKLHTFREKVRVRYDRTDPLPSTRLDYDYDMTQLGHVQPGKARKFETYKDRNEQLFPIVDPNLKKDSDFVIINELKKQIVVARINPLQQ